MRLLHAQKHHFQDFIGSDIPPYIILSHRWGKDEVSYQEFQRKEELTESLGLRKILDFCEHGPKLYLNKYAYGFDRTPVEWVWIDTCCIDKSSSAELSEAINSMFSWYNRAKLCCAYLQDVEDAGVEQKRGYKQFQRSEWFRRGWTLQELLAPPKLEFLDTRWRPLGDKRELKREISATTGIGIEYLEVPLSVFDASVAERMSWASQRKSTRIEDVAYCLLGLLEVNIPLLYGEGKRAFRRLQEEIIRTCHDESIFAWTSGEQVSRALANHPSCFAKSQSMSKGLPKELMPWKTENPYTITNLGLQLEACYVSDSAYPGNIFVFLNCHNSRESFPFILQLQNSPVWQPGRERKKWIPVSRNQAEIRQRLATRLQDSTTWQKAMFAVDSILINA